MPRESAKDRNRRRLKEDIRIATIRWLEKSCKCKTPDKQIERMYIGSFLEDVETCKRCGFRIQ